MKLKVSYIFIHEGFENKNSNKNEVINEVINGVIKFGENEMKVLNLINENNYITKKEICQNTGLSKSTTDRVISNLKEKDAIKRIGANKNGYWKIIMTITDKTKSKNQKYIVNGTGDYTKEKYDNPEEFTIEDIEKYMKNK